MSMISQGDLVTSTSLTSRLLAILPLCNFLGTSNLNLLGMALSPSLALGYSIDDWTMIVELDFSVNKSLEATWSFGVTLDFPIDGLANLCSSFDGDHLSSIKAVDKSS